MLKNVSVSIADSVKYFVGLTPTEKLRVIKAMLGK
jgi:hypothetical protein